MTLKEELKSKQDALVALKARIEANDAEAIAEGEKLKAEIEAKTAEVQQAEKKSALLGMIGTTDKKEDDAMSEVKTARTLGEHFVKNMPESHGSRFSISAPEFIKAYSDPMAVGTVASPQVPRALVTDIDRNIVPEVLPQTYLRGLFGAETIQGNALTFYTEGALEYAAGKPYGFDVTAEGAAKPQVSFADPTAHTVALTKVAAFIKETNEYIDDAPFLASAINGRLLNYLRLREEAFLLSELAGTSGIQADTTSWTNSDMADAQAIADLIFAKMMSVQEQSGFAADAIIMNPAVWQTLRLGKLSATNAYIGGGYFADGQGRQIWGVPVYLSSFVDAPVSGSAKGDIWVGSFKACGSVVSKGGVRVEATNSDQDDFVKNKMTIRAEERLALAARIPAGFCKITKAAS